MARRTTLVTPGKRSRGNKPFRRVGIFMLIVLMLAASAVAGLSYLGSSINNGGNNIGGEAGFSLGDDEELVDDVRVTLKDQEMEALCGTRKNANLPESTFVHMAQIREFLAGQAVGGEAFNDAVSLPVVMRQSTVNAQRAVAPTQDELFKALAVILNDEMAKIAELPLADQGAAVIALLDDKLMEPKFADMVNQALLTFPAFAEQNDWSVEFDAQVKEAMSREEDGELAIGFWAFVHFANAEAKAANDFSQLRMNTDENLGKGDFNFWRTYCHLCATMRQLFTFEGAQALESVDNWKLPEVADWANTRIIRADQQEDRPAYIFVHRDKMGRITFKMGFNLADSRVELFEKKATQIPESPKVTPEDPADPPANPPAEVEPPTSTPDPDPEPKEYPATLIHYDKESGATLGTDNLGNFKVGTTVTGKAKTFTGYTADVASVSGVMVEGGLTLKIPYTKVSDPDPEPKEYPATLIHYDKESGATLGTDNLGNFKVGTTVTGKAKTFTGYTADVASVSGVMVEGGLTLKIPYTPKHDGDGQKDPEADPENKPGFDPGIGDNEPDDGSGDQEEEEPEGVDHENGATENPDDNQNNDGSDPTKPVTPPITDDGQSDEWTDHDTGDVSDGDGDINNGIIVDEDGDNEQEVVVDASVVQEIPEEVTPVEEIVPEGAPVEEIAPEGAGEFQENQPVM